MAPFLYPGIMLQNICSIITKFELNLNDNSMMIIPMDIGSVFTYSGFLLTHRQQIYNESSSATPFLNIVSYNSKRLFEPQFVKDLYVVGKKIVRSCHTMAISES